MSCVEGREDEPEPRIPVSFHALVGRLNADYLPTRGERLIYQKERQCWRLVKLAKGDPLTIGQVEALARELGALTSIESLLAPV
jgi:hypothetical protein